MSYDILLVARRPGQTFDEALDGGGDGGPLGPERLAQWARIETRARALLGDVLVHVDPERGAELSHEATGLQVELYADQGAVAYPYWEHEDRAAFHRLVHALVAVVVEETGLEAYDPQTDAPFDGVPDDRVGVEGTAAIVAERGARASGVPAADVPAVPDAALTRWRPAPGRAPGPREPLTGGNQRTRALRYLVCGALVVLLAGGRVLGGDVTAWSVALLAGGLLDVGIGVVVWRRWVSPGR
ncbi:hypothetical protein ACFUMH_10635 [Cellulomonas sp. NPDC057328]|uniref:hypothetical protein n=1 Tax=Cellulomonas sp. NPDC057328 TaxID=3346101 RepID=UPI003626C923